MPAVVVVAVALERLGCVLDPFCRRRLFDRL